jgi:hypothetical protein
MQPFGLAYFMATLTRNAQLSPTRTRRAFRRR